MMRRSSFAAVTAILIALAPLSVLSFTPDASTVGKQPSQASTDRQSSSLGDLDRKSELERRVEDGTRYEHEELDDLFSQYGNFKTIEVDDGIPTVHGIFCGYRYTHDDYQRLKSANLS